MEAGATEDVVGWGVVGAEAEQADGMVEAAGAKDEVTVFEGDEAEKELAGEVDGVERGVGCAIGS